MGIDPSSFSRSAASARAQLKLEARLAAKQTNRKEIDRNSTQTAFLNQTERRLRTTDVVSKSINSLLESFSTATDGLSTIKGSLEEIRGIIDSALKGTLSSTSEGQSRINELVNQIKSISENTSYGGKKFFSGDFSYSAILNTKNNIYNKSFVNNNTGTIAPPEPPNTGYTVSSLGNIGGEGGQGLTTGLTWENTTNFNSTSFFGNGGAPNQIAINDNYVVKRGTAGANVRFAVYDKATGNQVEYFESMNATLNDGASYGKLMALNNNNKLAVVSDNKLYLDSMITGANGAPIELKDGSGNSIGGISSIDISNDYVVASKSSANGGVAYVFNANTGAFIDEIRDDASEPYANFGTDIAIDGNKIAIGAQYLTVQASINGQTGGYAKVYNLSSGQAVEERKIDIEYDNSYIMGSLIDNGHGTKLDFEDGKIVTNAGFNTLVLDANTGNTLGSFSHLNTTNDRDHVYDYQMKNGRIAVQTTNWSNSFDTRVFDANNFRNLNDLYVSNSSNHNVGGRRAIAFDGTNLFSQADVSTVAISRATITSVNNAIKDEDAYGKKVIASGDFLISLSPGRDEGGIRESGSIFVYDKNTGGLVKEFKNIASSSTQFSQSNNNYLDNFEISASGNKIALLDKAANSASVFNIATNEVNKFSIDAADDTIAISGNRIAVGSSETNGSGYNSIKVFNQAADGSVSLGNTLSSTNGGIGGSLGDSIDISGDILVAMNSNRGLVEVFDLNSGNLMTTVSLANRNANLNSKVSIDGDKFAVSNINNNNEVGVFDLNGNNLSSFRGAGNTATSLYGESIDLSGDLLVVGASQEDNGSGGRGAVYTYNLSDNSEIQKIFSTADANRSNSGFGSSVSISGSSLIVGAAFGISSTGEFGGNMSRYNISGGGTGGSYIDYPMAKPRSLIASLRTLDIDIASQQKGSLGTGTFSALQDISISTSVASVGGKRDAANFRDLYDIDQMLANLGSISKFVNDEVKLLGHYQSANDIFKDFNRDRLRRLTNNQVATQANLNPNQVANLLP